MSASGGRDRAVPAARAIRTESVLGGTGTFVRLFEQAFARAEAHLDTESLHALYLHAPSRNLAALGWLSNLAELREQFDTWFARSPSARNRLRAEDRSRLRQLLGDALWLNDPRKAFVVAIAIDQAWSDFSTDWPRLSSSETVPAPVAFFSSISNPAPELGQMTPMALCRRWLTHLWFVGSVRKFNGFGAIPETARILVPAAVQNTLEDAREANELRFGLAQWARHDASHFQVANTTGGFAIERTAPDGSDPAAILDAAARNRVHLLVLPELALHDQALARVVDHLRTARRTFPALVAAGLCHRRIAASQFVNEAVLLDRDGRELMRHEKLEPYRDPKLGLEAIVPRRPQPYRFVDTPVGRLVLNICRDVRADVPSLLNKVLGATLLVVPSHSTRLDYVTEEARVLGARQRAITVCVNADFDGNDDRSCTYAPLRGSKASLLEYPRRNRETGEVVRDLEDRLLVVTARMKEAVGELEASHFDC